MKEAFKQTNKEALVTMGLYVFFFFWWTLFAFGLGSGNPDSYSYVFGMPAWFFYSCVLGYPVMTLLLWGAVKLFFKDIPLDSDDSDAGKDTI